MAITVRDLAAFKAERRRFIMLTAYDFTTAQILEEAEVPVILVGDSLAQVVLGYQTTIPVTMEEMLHHTRAVVRGAPGALVVADMPFGSYGASIEQGVANATRFLKEGNAQAVKFEGADAPLAEALSARGIPVMAHLGLTPQSVHAMGGYRVQARSAESADKLLADARAMEKSGAFSLVLEGIPAQVAASVTNAVAVPTIGIGAGPSCDGQVLVSNDLWGMGRGPDPRFVKRYANLRQVMTDAVQAFEREVLDGTFPSDLHSYTKVEG